MTPMVQQPPFRFTALPSVHEGQLASVAGAGFQAEIRRYDCDTTREWAFKPSRPYISLTLRAGTMRRRGAYLLASRRAELTDLGRERFTAFVRELWTWLVTEVELANGAALGDEGRDDLRAIARRLLLSDDPVNEPMEIAQAGA